LAHRGSHGSFGAFRITIVLFGICPSMLFHVGLTDVASGRSLNHHCLLYLLPALSSMSLSSRPSGERPRHSDNAAARPLNNTVGIRGLLRRANALVDEWDLDGAIQVFDNAHVEPPQEWLLEKANDAWNGRHFFAGYEELAIQLFARTGEVARLNKIGEHLALDAPGESVFDAFFGAGNLQRIQDVSEHFLRDGFDEGLYGFSLLQTTPSNELLETFARALLERTGWPYRMLGVVKAAGIRLPRGFVLEAAEQYRRTIGTVQEILLEIADHEPPEEPSLS
jgi:hypothetical protein